MPRCYKRSGIGPKDHLSSSINTIVDNSYVGHGIDHEVNKSIFHSQIFIYICNNKYIIDYQEIAVMYEWLDKWNDSNGNLPKGGVMVITYTNT